MLKRGMMCCVVILHHDDDVEVSLSDVYTSDEELDLSVTSYSRSKILRVLKSGNVLVATEAGRFEVSPAQVLTEQEALELAHDLGDVRNLRGELSSSSMIEEDGFVILERSGITWGWLEGGEFYGKKKRV